MRDILDFTAFNNALRNSIQLGPMGPGCGGPIGYDGPAYGAGLPYGGYGGFGGYGGYGGWGASPLYGGYGAPYGGFGYGW